MANSTCPKCDGHRFEIKENSPAQSNYKLMFVQCSGCGAVIGVMDYYNIGAKIAELEKKIDRATNSNLSSASVASSLDVINNNIVLLSAYVKSKLGD